MTLPLIHEVPGPSTADQSSKSPWLWWLIQGKACLWTGMLEKTLESPLDSKEVKPVNPKGNQPWIFIKNWCCSWSSNTIAILCEEPVYWKRPWCCERLKVGEEGGDRGWDGWMASSTEWTWVWANPRRQWRTGKDCCAAVHGVAKSQTWLSDWTELIW